MYIFIGRGGHPWPRDHELRVHALLRAVRHDDRARGADLAEVADLADVRPSSSPFSRGPRARQFPAERRERELFVEDALAARRHHLFKILLGGIIWAPEQCGMSELSQLTLMLTQLMPLRVRGPRGCADATRGALESQAHELCYAARGAALPRDRAQVEVMSFDVDFMGLTNFAKSNAAQLQTARHRSRRHTCHSNRQPSLINDLLMLLLVDLPLLMCNHFHGVSRT